jgi:hypothetical protein
VRKHAARQRQAGREQHAGPVERMEAQDVLADQVHGRRPARGRQRVSGRRLAVAQQRCARA